MNTEILAVTLKVTSALEELEIPYVIGGSFASSLWGVSRLTYDTDVIADIHLSHIPELLGLLGAEFYVSPEAIEESITYRTSFNLIHLTSLHEVDIFLPKNRSFEKNQLLRGQYRAINRDAEQQVMFCTAEDIVLAKLERYRIGCELRKTVA